MSDDNHGDGASAGPRRAVPARREPPATRGGFPGGLRLAQPVTAAARGTASAAPARARRAGLLAAAVAGTLLTACGCSAGTSARTPARAAPAPAAPVTAPAAPAAPAQAAGRLALAAYTGMWRQMQAAGVTADWNDPRLASYASGEALQILVTGLRRDHRQGLVIKGTLVTHPQVISRQPPAGPDQVVIRDCSGDSHWLNYAAATGKLQDNVPGGHRLVEALVTRARGRWTVSRLAVHAEGTC